MPTTATRIHAGQLSAGEPIAWVDTHDRIHTGTVDGASGDARLGNAGVRVIGCPCGLAVHRLARAQRIVPASPTADAS